LNRSISIELIFSRPVKQQHKLNFVKVKRIVIMICEAEKKNL